MKKKSLSILIAVVLVLVCAVGATLAWLTDKTDTVTNTFTVGDINIDLTETWNADSDDEDTVNDHWEVKMVPGTSYAKDPTVTVKANSEACWLFLRVDKSANCDTYLEYTIDESWKPIADKPGYYYQEVNATTADVDFIVLTGNTVKVKDGVTKEQMEAAKEANPTLSFTAAAVQKENIETLQKAIANLPTGF